MFPWRRAESAASNRPSRDPPPTLKSLTIGRIEFVTARLWERDLRPIDEVCDAGCGPVDAEEVRSAEQAAAE